MRPRPRIGRYLRFRYLVAMAVVPIFVATWRSLLLAATAAERQKSGSHTSASHTPSLSQSTVVISARRGPQYTEREMDGGNSANLTYFCGGAEEKKHAYAGAWLASGERFRLGPDVASVVQPSLRSGDEKAGFSMAKLPWQAGGRHGNMEGASFMMMKRCCRREDEGAQRTANLFDFWVEHLSAYERMIDLMHVRDPSLLDELIDSIATRLRVRERALRERWWRAGGLHPPHRPALRRHGDAILRHRRRHGLQRRRAATPLSEYHVLGARRARHGLAAWSDVYGQPRLRTLRCSRADCHAMHYRSSGLTTRCRPRCRSSRASPRSSRFSADSRASGRFGYFIQRRTRSRTATQPVLDGRPLARRC